jgi:hypothetical protein
MRGALARSVLSILKSVIFGGSKLLVKSFIAIAGAKRKVKKSKKTMFRNLVKMGIPMDTAYDIAVSYASIGNEVLSIRKWIKMAREMDKESKMEP